MTGEMRELSAVLDSGPGGDAEEDFELTQQLRAELLDLDVEVEAAPAGEAPAGAKAIEALAIGGLVVKFALNSALLKSVVEATGAWLGRHGARSVKLTLDGDTLELTGVSSEDQARLVDEWIGRHASDA